MAEFTGQQVGRYHIIEQLDEGGMAIVYKAHDTRLERDVAIKFIRRNQVGADFLDKMLVRFEREAKRMAKFNHPNIVPIIDYGEHEGNPYLVMPFFAAGALKARLGKPMTYQEAARIVIPIAQALQYAHEQDTIHRDVKPANILMTDTGQPMLTDFGVAKILDLDEGQTLTGTGVGIGTPKYMAPEQWKNQVTTQTDVYALGVVFYELVTGHVPYNAETPAGVLEKQLTEPLTRPSEYIPGLPEEVENILSKSLAKKIEERYVDMNAFTCALEKVLYQNADPNQLASTITAYTTITDFDKESIPQPSTPKPKPVAAAHPAELQPKQPPVETRHKESRGIPKLWWGIGTAVLLLIVLVAGWTFMQRPAATPEPTIAATIAVASVQNPTQPADTQPAQAAASKTVESSITTKAAQPAAESSPTVEILPSTTPIKETAQEVTPATLPSPSPKGAPTPDNALLKLPRFALKTPEDGKAFETKGKMEFSWDSFPGAVSYRLEIIPEHSKNVIRFTTRETSKTQFSETFNWGGLFTWQVVALDQDDQPSAYSGQSYFNKPTLFGAWVADSACTGGGGWGNAMPRFNGCQKTCDGYLRNSICEKE
ncbi:MAG: protein kinase [Chloroflexota bacterium]